MIDLLIATLIGLAIFVAIVLVVDLLVKGLDL